jgi:hypothetical protein
MESRLRIKELEDEIDKMKSLDEQLEGMTIEEIDSFLESFHANDNPLIENEMDEEPDIEFRELNEDSE